jgi:hypothetical protein
LKHKHCSSFHNTSLFLILGVGFTYSHGKIAPKPGGAQHPGKSLALCPELNLCPLRQPVEEGADALADKNEKSGRVRAAAD